MPTRGRSESDGGPAAVAPATCRALCGRLPVDSRGPQAPSASESTPPGAAARPGPAGCFVTSIGMPLVMAHIEPLVDSEFEAAAGRGRGRGRCCVLHDTEEQAHAPARRRRLSIRRALAHRTHTLKRDRASCSKSRLRGAQRTAGSLPVASSLSSRGRYVEVSTEAALSGALLTRASRLRLALPSTCC
jgi:hypothetical protein